MATYTIDTSPLVNKAIRQLSATSTFLRELQVLDSNKTNFLNQRIRTALNEIRKIVDAQREYDARQLDETTKFSTKPRPDAEAVAKEHADFIVKEVKALLNKKDVEVYEYRVVNPIDVQLNKENLELKEQLKQKTSELLAAQKEIARLNAELAKLTLAKEDLEKALAAEKLKFSGLLKAKLKVDVRLKAVRAKLAAEKTNNSGLQGQLAILQGQLNQKEQELRTEKTNNSARVPMLEGDVRTLQGQLSALQTSSKVEKEGLEKKLSELQNLYTTLQSTEQKLVDNNTSLLEANRIAIAANETLKEKYEAELLLKTQEISTLRQKLEGLQKSLSDAQKDAIRRRAERAEDVAVIYEQDKDKLHAEIDDLRGQLKLADEEYQRKLATLQSQSSAQPAPTSLLADLQKITELQTKIGTLETALEAEIEKTTNALKTGAEYQSKISELTEEKESLQRELAAALKTTSEQVSEVSSSHNETKVATDELEKLKASHATQIVTLNAKIKELEAQLAAKPISGTVDRGIQDLDTIIEILNKLQKNFNGNLAFELAVSELEGVAPEDKSVLALKTGLISVLKEYSDTLLQITNRQSETQSTVPSEIIEIQEVSSAEQNRIASLEEQIKQIQESEKVAQENLEAALLQNTELKKQLHQITTQLQDVTKDRDAILSTYQRLIRDFKNIGGDLEIQLSIADYDNPKDTREITAFLSKFTVKIKELKERIRETAVREDLQNILGKIGDKIQNMTFDAKNGFGQALLNIADRIEEYINSVQQQVDKIYGRDIPLDLKDAYDAFATQTKKLISDFRDAAKVMSNNESQSSKIFGISYNVMGEMYEAVVLFTKNLEKQWKTKTESIINVMQNSFETAMESVQTVIKELQSNEIPAEARNLYSKSLEKFKSLASDTEERLQSWVELKSQPTRENPDEFTAMQASIVVTADELAQIWGDFKNTLQETLKSVIQGDQMLRTQLNRANQRLEAVNSTIIGQEKKLQQIAGQLKIMGEYNPTTILDTILDSVTTLQQNMGIPKFEYQEKLNKISRLETYIKQLETMNESVIALNDRLGESNANLEQQLQSAQPGIPQQMRSGIGSPSTEHREVYLPEIEVQGGYQPVSGGYDSPTYTPIIAAATGSLLWWGFGGLLVFLILIVIYLLGREIYRTQFKSETDRKNIK